MPVSKFSVIEYHAPQRPVPVASDTLIPFGILVAKNPAGFALPASDAAGLTVAGVAYGAAGTPPDAAELPTDNTGKAAGKESVNTRTGIFRFQNSGVQPVTAAELGQPVFVKDERTVAKTTTNSMPAGVAIGLEAGGYVWVFVGPVGTLPGSPSIL